MDEFTVAGVSYLITIVISFLVAGLIQLMVAIFTRYARSTPEAEDPASSEAAAPASDNAAIAAVIAIAKNQ